MVYSPRNYDGRFRGPLLARAALAGSENVPGGRAGVRSGRTEAAAVPHARRAHAPSSRRRRITGSVSRWGTPKSVSTSSPPRTRRSPAAANGSSRPGCCETHGTGKRGASSLSGLRSGSPISSPTARPASTSSGEAAASSSRSRSRSRPARRRPTTTTGPSGTPGTSPSASGLATSIARRSGIRAASPARRRSSTV